MTKVPGLRQSIQDMKRELCVISRSMDSRYIVRIFLSPGTHGPVYHAWNAEHRLIDVAEIPPFRVQYTDMKRELCVISRSMDSRCRWVAECVQMSLAAVGVWNEVGLRLHCLQKGERPEDGMSLASALNLLQLLFLKISDFGRI
mgnify:CR=1 FL=1